MENKQTNQNTKILVSGMKTLALHKMLLSIFDQFHKTGKGQRRISRFRECVIIVPLNLFRADFEATQIGRQVDLERVSKF